MMSHHLSLRPLLLLVRAIGRIIDPVIIAPVVIADVQMIIVKWSQRVPFHLASPYPVDRPIDIISLDLRLLYFLLLLLLFLLLLLLLFLVLRFVETLCNGCRLKEKKNGSQF